MYLYLCKAVIVQYQLAVIERVSCVLTNI